MLSITYLEMALRLLLALALGGIVGYEREKHKRPAGFRTHILVCVGSALIMQVSAYGFAEGAAGAFYDPGRIAAQVVTGVGFLGAGTILRHGNTITGLTTAASLWIVSGIGLAVGIGYYAGALMTTLMVLISLILLRSLEGSFARMKNLRRLWMKGVDQPGLLGNISTIFGDMGVHVVNLEIGDSTYVETYKSDVVSMDFMLRIPAQLNSEDILKKVAMQEGVLEAGWEVEEMNENS